MLPFGTVAWFLSLLQTQKSSSDIRPGYKQLCAIRGNIPRQNDWEGEGQDFSGNANLRLQRVDKKNAVLRFFSFLVLALHAPVLCKDASSFNSDLKKR